jgi:outer membrane receptor for ferrienterochelin and colicin
VRDGFYALNETIGILPTERMQYNSDLEEQFRFLWNPGLFFHPVMWLKIKLNAFHAFRNPDLYDLLHTYGQYEGNPDLKPETSYGGDVGFRIEFEYFFLESVFFCTSYASLIRYLLSYGFVYKPMNVDNALSCGGEFRCLLPLCESVNLYLSYTLDYLNNIEDLANEILLQLPGHPFQSFYAKLEYTDKHVNVGTRAEFEDKI